MHEYSTPLARPTTVNGLLVKVLTTVDCPGAAHEVVYPRMAELPSRAGMFHVSVADSLSGRTTRPRGALGMVTKNDGDGTIGGRR